MRIKVIPDLEEGIARNEKVVKLNQVNARINTLAEERGIKNYNANLWEDKTKHKNGFTITNGFNKSINDLISSNKPIDSNTF
jgi:hypothetical protein